MNQPDWKAARAAMMLDPSVTNLNTGSFGPSPRPVFDRVSELRRLQAAEPMDFILRQSPPLLWEARCRMAKFVGTDPTRLIFTQNVSSAVNMIASGMTLDGGEVLTSDREYGAMHWCWERFAERCGLELKTFHLPPMPKSPTEIVDAIAAAITPRTKLLFFTHVYAATGMVVPAREICELARQRGVLSVVDGAHAIANLPLAIDQLDCDFYAANAHKWLLAPTGTGFLVLGRNSLDSLQPMHVSWGYKNEGTCKPDEQDEFGSTPRIRRLEFEGTRELCPWFCVPEAIDFQEKWDCTAIRKRQHELAAYVRNRVDGLRLATPSDPRMHGPMTAFWVPTDLPAEENRKRLWEARIEIPVTDWPDGRIIRVSTNFYNTEAEVDRFAQMQTKCWR